MEVKGEEKKENSPKPVVRHQVRGNRDLGKKAVGKDRGKKIRFKSHF